jgi:molybdopterin-containing oxidoreductase family iron-sulfur binding subunit
MMTNDPKELTREAPAERKNLGNLTGKRFWRSLDEWSGTDEFRSLIERHFPSQLEEVLDPVTRRTFLKVMGASLAFAGATGCSPVQPTELIYPYASNPPTGMSPGRALYFATAMPFGGYGTGVLVESNMGRPTKIEGNALHPASLGAADAITQASVLSLYDPDRSQSVMFNGRAGTWDAFLNAMQQERLRHRADGGARLRFLTGPLTSPSIVAQLRTLMTADHYPSAKWYQYAPVSRASHHVASKEALGGAYDTVYDFSKADVVVSLDSNFLVDGPGHLAYARQFTDRRRVSDGKTEISRFYAVESSPTLTGANADHRLRVRPSHVEVVARAVAQGAGVAAGQGSGLDAAATAWIASAVKDLQAAKGKSIVVAGDSQSPAVHALALAINQALGNVGTTVKLIPAVEAQPVDHTAQLAELTKEMEAGSVDLLVMIGVNPYYDAPADIGFAAAMESKVRLRVHLGDTYDETAFMSNWHVNAAHYLESWGDVVAFDGTVSIMQPLIAPLYDGKTPQEVLNALMGQGGRAVYDLVREHWIATVKAATPAEFDVFWQKALNDGKVTMPAAAAPAAAPAAAAAPAQAPPPAAPTVNPSLFAQPPVSAGEALEIAFRPDPCLWDGSLANNGWLQELPKPLTKLTWDNAAIMGIRTAERFGLVDGSMVELSLGGRKVSAPTRVLAGHPEGFVTLHLGFGRTRAGSVGNGVGTNAYALRTSNALWNASGLELRATGESYDLAVTEHHNMISAGAEVPEPGSLQDHYAGGNETVGTGPAIVDGQRGREIFKVATMQEFLSDPLVFHGGGHGPADGGHGEGTPHESMLPPQFEYKNNKWAMTIDTQACIGCNACVIACQSENNIPVVGKAQVLVNREMHWIRIDTYFEGKVEDPATYFQPVVCQQCENAPCETVCPVGATVHSEEGLNDMVYNRCVGTRYCSNNCPFKVRRYNFLKYSDQSPLAQLRSNPNVTIRARGVMEKCTYCVQRIWRARIGAEIENRPVRDGEIRTACQQTCPTDAIVFGNANDHESRVAKLKETKLNYTLLDELNVFPRTSYLGRVTNPNPELKA